VRRLARWAFMVTVLVMAAAGCMAPMVVQPGADIAGVTSPTAPPSPSGTPEPVLLTATPTGTLPASTSIPTPVLTAKPAATATWTPTVTPSPTATLGPTPDGVARAVRVPILMYHYISAPPAGADAYRRDLSVAPAQFESHLDYLQRAGYQAITLDDLLYALAQGRELPPKPIILTFDDGYEDNYLNAFPLLQKHGMVGHFFIISDFVNAGRPGYMTWPQIEEMGTAGQYFGSHSRDHPDLRGKPVDYLVWQALGGKEAIQEHLGYHPRWISYPSGGYDAQVIAVYKSAGYWGGLTTAQGTMHTLDGVFELKRVRVRGSHTAADLGKLLELDW
jgi:peptidoglycan/xylan/chitin deacetylase (PgdA/CDA1 family)